jgi:hypothetical protein
MRRISISAFVLVSILASLIGGATNAAGGQPETAGVLLGPSGSSAAFGLTSDNDDYTNLSIGSDPFGPSGLLTTNPASAIFKNTVQNTGTLDDAFIISAPLRPAGFTVEISTDYGERWTLIEPWSAHVIVPVAYRSAFTFLVRINAPAGLPTLNTFDTVIRATSTVSPSVSNQTIDRIYTGFLTLEQSVRVMNSKGTGRVSEAASGDELEFMITYTNVSTSGGVGCAPLTAQNIVISANGNAPPNNWAATTEHVVGASDNRGGLIVGDRPGSSSLTNMVMSLDAGQSGVFKFRRRIR